MSASAERRPLVATRELTSLGAAAPSRRHHAISNAAAAGHDGPAAALRMPSTASARRERATCCMLRPRSLSIDGGLKAAHVDPASCTQLLRMCCRFSPPHALHLRSRGAQNQHKTSVVFWRPRLSYRCDVALSCLPRHPSCTSSCGALTISSRSLMSIADGVVSGVTALRVELLCLQRPHLHSSGPQLESMTQLEGKGWARREG